MEEYDSVREKSSEQLNKYYDPNKTEFSEAEQKAIADLKDFGKWYEARKKKFLQEHGYWPPVDNSIY